MNREIEFRGKHNDEWIYGYLLEEKHKDKSKYYITKHCEIGSFYLVKANTIGQYTGLKDKNGTKIYEGDIVNNGEYTLRVLYNPRIQSYVLADESDWLNESTDRIYDCDDIEEKYIDNIFEYNCESYEVIGNIYEREV